MLQWADWPCRLSCNGQTIRWHLCIIHCLYINEICVFIMKKLPFCCLFDRIYLKLFKCYNPISFFTFMIVFWLKYKTWQKPTLTNNVLTASLLRGSPTEIWPQIPKWGSSKYYCSHCLEGKNIHESPGPANFLWKIQSKVYKVSHNTQHNKGYWLACPRLSCSIHQHHGKNLEYSSWTPTCIYSGGCQITC